MLENDGGYRLSSTTHVADDFMTPMLHFVKTICYPCILTLCSFDGECRIVNARMPSPWAVGSDKCDSCLVVGIEVPQLEIPSVGISQNWNQIDWFVCTVYDFWAHEKLLSEVDNPENMTFVAPSGLRPVPHARPIWSCGGRLHCIYYCKTYCFNNPVL